MAFIFSLFSDSSKKIEPQIARSQQQMNEVDQKTNVLSSKIFSVFSYLNDWVNAGPKTIDSNFQNMTLLENKSKNFEATAEASCSEIPKIDVYEKSDPEKSNAAQNNSIDFSLSDISSLLDQKSPPGSSAEEDQNQLRSRTSSTKSENFVLQDPLETRKEDKIDAIKEVDETEINHTSISQEEEIIEETAQEKNDSILEDELANERKKSVSPVIIEVGEVKNESSSDERDVEFVSKDLEKTAIHEQQIVQDASELFSSLDSKKEDELKEVISFKNYVNNLKKMAEISPNSKPVIRAKKNDSQKIDFTMRPTNSPIKGVEKKRIMNAAKVFISSVMESISHIQDSSENDRIAKYLKEEIFDPFDYLLEFDSPLYFDLKKLLIDIYKHKLKDLNFKNSLKNKIFSNEEFKLVFADLNIINWLELWDDFKKSFKNVDDFQHFRKNFAKNTFAVVQRRASSQSLSRIKNETISSAQLKECIKSQEMLESSVDIIHSMMNEFPKYFKSDFHNFIKINLEEISYTLLTLNAKFNQLLMKGNDTILLSDLDDLFSSDEWKNYSLTTSLFTADYQSFLKTLNKIKDDNFASSLSDKLFEKNMDSRLGLSSLVIKIVQNPPKIRLSLKESKCVIDSKKKLDDIDQNSELGLFLKDLYFKMDEAVLLCDMLIFLKS